MRAGTKPARPSWATRIEKLRAALAMSQTELADRLGVSAMAVSRWERGINEPSAACYIQLGKLAGIGNAECWFFWSRAGLNKSDLKHL